MLFLNKQYCSPDYIFACLFTVAVIGIAAIISICGCRQNDNNSGTFKNMQHGPDMNEPPVSTINDGDSGFPVHYHWSSLFINETSVESVEIELTDRDAQYWSEKCKEAVLPIEVTIADATALRSIVRSMGEPSNHCPVIPDNAYYVIPTIPHGRAIVKLKEAQVTIWITEFGFSLEEEPEAHSRFYSVLLADDIQEAYFSKTGSLLPDRFIDCLTGINDIRKEESWIKDRVEERRKKARRHD